MRMYNVFSMYHEKEYKITVIFYFCTYKLSHAEIET